MKKGDRVQVVPEMRSRFWDIGDTVGTVMEMDGFAIVEWPNIPEQHRIDTAYLEIFEP